MSGRPWPKDYPCGTRAKYVGGCRCEACKAANRRAVAARDARAVAEAIALAPQSTSPAPQVWTLPDGSRKVRLYQRACPGVHGEPCKHRRHLRKDSKGGLCGDCRLRLVWNGLVDAGPVIKHVRKLSKQGIGYKSVAAAASVSATTIGKLLNGKRTRIRAAAARRILAIDRDAVADGGLVRAGRTHALIQRLLEEGFTKTELARRLGSRAKVPALQIRADLILARTASKVERFYNRIMVE